jgi:hypothetical protein
VKGAWGSPGEGASSPEVSLLSDTRIYIFCRFIHRIYSASRVFVCLVDKLSFLFWERLWGRFGFYYIRIIEDESQGKKIHNRTMIHSETGEL